MAVRSTGAYHKQNLAWPVLWVGAGLDKVTLVRRYEVALLHLARTKKGAYYVDPEYGSIIYRLRTQGMNEDLLDTALADLQLGVARYIPDITIIDIKEQRDDQTWKLHIFWNIRGANQRMHGELAKVKVAELSL